MSAELQTGRLIDSAFETMLDRYAKLIAVYGANVQPGQLVNVSAEAAHRDFALRVAKEAYRAGAANVFFELTEPRLHRFKFDVLSDEYLSQIPHFVPAKFRQILDERGAAIKLVGPEFPMILSDVDPKKVSIERKAFYQSLQFFYEEGLGKSKVQWTMGAVPTPAWAKRVFPELSEHEAERAMWESIFKIVRVDREDFLEVWKEHNRKLKRRSARLDALKIKQLHFTGPGTDLVVGLSEKARFKGGADIGPRGVEFEPNIPTEECFTTPDCRITSGFVRATRPILVNGVLVEGLSMTFDKGELVSFDAKAGASAFREYINTDPGAKRLGEVALVGTDSPIFQSGRVFEEILLDENAACHIAIGSAYKFCLDGGNDLSEADAAAIGCNESIVHTDIMISSDEVDVTVTTRSGDSVDLIRKGEWIGELR